MTHPIEAESYLLKTPPGGRRGKGGLDITGEQRSPSKTILFFMISAKKVPHISRSLLSWSTGGDLFPHAALPQATRETRQSPITKSPRGGNQWTLKREVAIVLQGLKGKSSGSHNPEDAVEHRSELLRRAS